VLTEGDLTMRRFHAVATVILGLGAMASCGGTRPSKYYQLEVPAGPPASASASEVHPVSLLVGRLTASHLYREDRIVYRSNNGQMGAYEYHRWAEPPTEMVEAMLVRLLRESGHYRSVQTLRSNTRGDYIVRGRLDDFEEVSDGQIAARVTLEIDLYEIKSGTVVWSKFYSQDEPVSAKEVPAVVKALNRNLQRGLAQVAAGLDQYFSAHPPK
jgi:ABC-type uncharacterized transport system auxiliary subunit